MVPNSTVYVSLGPNLTKSVEKPGAKWGHL
jgi:hypothetical protein